MSRQIPKYFSTATSVASKTVDRHAAPAEHILWAGWFCPFTQRSWILLEELDASYQYKEVNPYLKEPSFLEVSPKGLTPGLQMGSKTLYDSTIINEFLNEKFKSKVGLYPEDPYDRAIMRLSIDHINKSVVPAFFRLLQAQPNQPEKQHSALKEFRDALEDVAKNAQGPYFLGEQFSLVDAAIAPWAVRDFILRYFRGFVRDEVAGWRDWAAALEARESVVRTTSDPSKYVEFNGIFLRNELHSLAGQAAAKGQAIP